MFVAYHMTETLGKVVADIAYTTSISSLRHQPIYSFYANQYHIIPMDNHVCLIVFDLIVKGQKKLMDNTHTWFREDNQSQIHVILVDGDLLNSFLTQH